MSEDRRASQTDDQDFQRSCLAAIWFEVVDRYIQQRCYQGNDNSIKAENKQAAAPVCAIDASLIFPVSD